MDRRLSLGPLTVYAYHDYKRVDGPDGGPFYAGIKFKGHGPEVMV